MEIPNKLTVRSLHISTCGEDVGAAAGHNPGEQDIDELTRYARKLEVRVSSAPLTRSMRRAERMRFNDEDVARQLAVALSSQ